MRGPGVGREGLGGMGMVEGRGKGEGGRGKGEGGRGRDGVWDEGWEVGVSVDGVSERLSQGFLLKERISLQRNSARNSPYAL